MHKFKSGHIVVVANSRSRPGRFWTCAFGWKKTENIFQTYIVVEVVQKKVYTLFYPVRAELSYMENSGSPIWEKTKHILQKAWLKCNMTQNDTKLLAENHTNLVSRWRKNASRWRKMTQNVANWRKLTQIDANWRKFTQIYENWTN